MERQDELMPSLRHALLRIVRINGIFGIAAIIVGSFILVLPEEIVYFIDLISGRDLLEGSAVNVSIVRLSGAGILGLSMIFAASRYLGGMGLAPSFGRVESEPILHDTTQIQAELRNQRDLIEKLVNTQTHSTVGQFTDEERATIVERLSKSIDSQIGEGLLSALETKYGASIRQSKAYENIRRECEKMRGRLWAETESLGRRGNLNLVLGSAISLIGIFFLGWSVIYAPTLETEGRDLAAYYVPRTTFVVMIELFAFFFLNLYRTSLNEIKYFQNELTNIESRIISLEALIMAENMRGLATFANKLTATERNFTLAKGQTTVELEQKRLDNAGLKDLIAALSGVVQKGKK